MPIGLLLFAALLVVLTIVALLSGLSGVAAICLGALFTTAVTLRDRSRSRATGLHAVARRAVQVERRIIADGGVLVAMVYPDERAHLPALIAEAKLFCDVLVVLAIGPVTDPQHAASEALRVETDQLGREQNPELLGVLESATRAAGRPITLMRAFGADPAYSALEITRLICPSHLVVLRAADTSANAQRQRAILVWESLRSPRPAVRVKMISTGEEETLTFDLDSTATPPSRGTRG